MAKQKNQFNFTNLNFAEEDKEKKQQDYNPISGITKVESLEFDFEPDEDNNENSTIIQNDKIENKELLKEDVITDNKRIIISQDINDISSKTIDDNLNEITNENDYLLNIDNNEDDILLIPDINKENINLKENNNKSLDNIHNDDLIKENDYLKFDTNFNNEDFTEDILQNIPITTDEKENNEKQDINNYLNKDTELNSIDLFDSDNILIYENNDDYQDNDNIIIENEEDILAEVLAQDYTLPVSGFEEFAKRKRIREEASKILDGDNYSNINFNFNPQLNSDNEEKKIIDSDITDITIDKEIIDDINNEEDEELSLDNIEEIGSIKEKEYLSNEDNNIIYDEEVKFPDVDITDIPDIGYEEDKNSIKELLENNDDNKDFFEEEFDYNLINTENIENQTIVDKKSENNIKESDLSYTDDTEDIEDIEFNNIEEEDFFYGDIEKEVDDDSYDDGGFQIGLDEDNDEEEEEDDFFSDDFEDFSLEEFSEEEFSEEDEFSEEIISNQKVNEFTENTQQYLNKLKNIIRKIPKLKTEFTEKTKAFLLLLKKIKNEISEEGVKKVTKKYLIKTFTVSKNKIKNTKKNISLKLTEHKNKPKNINNITDNNENDDWGMGPSSTSKAVENTNEKKVNHESAWDEDDEINDEENLDFDEEFSFSTADMLMEDSELGLEEFGQSTTEELEEEEDNVDYSGIIGKFRKLKKISFRWIRLLYKYFDNIFDFEKNWWKIIDFIAVIVLTMSMAMIIAYYIWHK